MPLVNDDVIAETNPSQRRELQLTVHSLNQEVIFETQLNSSNREKERAYHDIMASIGLESPASSEGTRTKEDNNTYPYGQLINTPIRNSANCLMSMGRHILTPRHNKIWEFRSKSPLGGQGNQGGDPLP